MIFDGRPVKHRCRGTQTRPFPALVVLQKLRERVAAEIRTTFASHYDKEVSLADALRLEEIAVYGQQATGRKYLINPNKGLER